MMSVGEDTYTWYGRITNLFLIEGWSSKQCEAEMGKANKNEGCICRDVVERLKVMLT